MICSRFINYIFTGINEANVHSFDFSYLLPVTWRDQVACASVVPTCQDGSYLVYLHAGKVVNDLSYKFPSFACIAIQKFVAFVVIGHMARVRIVGQFLPVAHQRYCSEIIGFGKFTNKFI